MTDSLPRTDDDTERQIFALLADVPDPEIPILNIVDLGIVRWVRADDAGVTVGIAPTYTGCPATEVIEASVVAQLRRYRFDNVQIERVLSPAWTTDWLTEAGREKLRAYGIAPPADANASKRALLGRERKIECPRCRSRATTEVSEFGSTPCKASYKCDSCLEPFEYFKCI